MNPTHQEFSFVANLKPEEGKLIRLCAANMAWDEELGAILITPKNHGYARAMWKILRCRRQAYPWLIVVSAI